MAAGGVSDDAGQDEDHGGERDHVREMLVRPMAHVLVRRRNQGHDHVRHEGRGHDRNADAADDRKPSKLAPDCSRPFYH